jgi:ribosomal protein S18 acetylase RimI-like enzyme
VDVASETLRRLERAAVASWPAPEQAEIDGWLWRYASGGSLRANSVSALAFTGDDPEQAITEAERRYRARGAVARFTLTGVSEPADLDARLAARGYARGQDHVTMLKEVAASPGSAPDVAASCAYSPEWLAVYLAGLGPERAAVAPSILARLPQRRMFFACYRGSDVVGSGLSVADGELASVQCMATRSELRRQGYARAVLCAIEAWAVRQGATRLYLQAERANVGAIALYQGFGFRVAGRYHVRANGR